MLTKDSALAVGLPKKTESLCPECLTVIEATMREENGKVVIEKTCQGSVRLVNCAFWGPAVQNVVSHSQSFVSLSDCYLSSDRKGNTMPLVEADGGKLQVRGCSFGIGENHTALKTGLRHAIVSENNGARGVAITSEIGDKAVLANNEPKEE